MLFRSEITKLEDANNVFSCQGWHYYLIENLRQIEKNELHLKLIFPSKLDFYEFKIRVLNSNGSHIKLRLEFDSWFIRLFAPHLDLTYDKIGKKIVKFYGPSNILDGDGDIQNVYIFYEQ